MTTYFSQEEAPVSYCGEPINGTFVFDPHGNVLKVDGSGNMVKEELAERPVPLELELERATPFPHKCRICYKNVKSRGFTHFKCRDVLAKLEKAKKQVVNMEFKLFCLRYTDKEVFLNAECIDD
jgi:hypothetical protein